MKRQWKVDQRREVGTVCVWKGDPDKLPAPWIKVPTEEHMESPKHTLEPGYHMIKKLDNLEWMERKFAEKGTL